MRRIALTMAVALCLLLAPAAATAARAWTTASVSQPNEDTVTGALAVTATGETVAVYNAGTGAAPFLDAVAFPAGGGSPATTTLQGSYVYDPVVASGGGTTIAAWASESSGDTIRVASRSDGGSFGSSQDLGAGQGGLVLRMNARGDAALLFVRYSNQYANQQLFLSVRPAGTSSFGTPVAISDVVRSDYHYNRDDMSLTPDGRIVIAWEELSSTGSVVKVAQRSLAGVASLPTQTLSAAGGTATRPWVATDTAGDAIVTWLDASTNGGWIGAIRAAIAGPGAPFGATQSIAGNAGRSEGARVVADGGGHAVIAWTDDQPTSQGGSWSVGPVKVATVTLPTGTITAPAALTSGAADDWGTLPAVDGAGNVVVYFDDSSSAELRAVRRPAGSTAFTGPETLICPRPLAAALASGFAGGSAEVLWRQTDGYVAHQGIRLTSDHDAAQASPGPCPPPPPAYVVMPSTPHPGDEITIDASGAQDPQAAVTTWAWDLDGDGSFEIGDGSNAVEHVHYPAAGDYTVSLRVTNGNGRGNTGSSTWPIHISVTSAGTGTDGGSPPPSGTGDGTAQSTPPAADPPPVTYGTTTVGGDTAPSEGYGSSMPPPYTGPAYQFTSDDPPTALQNMLVAWDPFSVERMLEAGKATAVFRARNPGTVSVRWLLDGLGDPVLATGRATVQTGFNLVTVTLTPEGKANFRHAIQWVPLRMQASYTTDHGTTTREVAGQISRDVCYVAPDGVSCHRGMWGHTKGGRRVGKVSHSEWPDIGGALWIADDTGVHGAATKFNDELLGGHGSDTLSGGSGDDVIWGDEWPDGNTTHQHDILMGGAGDDWIYASHGVNELVGGSGDDTIWSVYAVRAYIDAGSGDDRIVARRGTGTIDCGAGNDRVWVPRHGYKLLHCEDVRHTHASPFARLP